MKRIAQTAIASVMVLFVVSNVHAYDGKSLREALDDSNAIDADFWIYNDLTNAFAAAKKANKPLFVTFRCVPCEDCNSFDAEVAGGNDIIKSLAKEKFVAVRQVEMKGVDLSQFQFDYDLNWAAMFLNADGTVYARYGTQSAKGADAYNSVKGLKKTMEHVLELHKNYPNNKAELVGKRGSEKPISNPLKLPNLYDAEKRKGQTSRKNCIHCHMVHDSENTTAQKSDAFSNDLLWRYPLPENVGLEMDALNANKVVAVQSGSPAQKAGIKTGQTVTHLNGQVITSIADFQWVLHNLKNTDQELAIKTGQQKVNLKLAAGWKKSDISWRGSLWSVSPVMRVWMPVLNDERRKALKLEQGVQGLEVRWINGGKPGGQAARRSGLKQKDIVVALEGKPLKMDHSQFNMHVKLNYNVGDKLPLTVLRNGRKIDLQIELVE